MKPRLERESQCVFINVVRVSGPFHHVVFSLNQVVPSWREEIGLMRPRK